MIEEGITAEENPTTIATKIGQTPGKAAKMTAIHRTTIDEAETNLGKEGKAEAVQIFKHLTTETKSNPWKVLNRQLCPVKLRASPVQILIEQTVRIHLVSSLRK
jgi:hypothetical protein